MRRLSEDDVQRVEEYLKERSVTHCSLCQKKLCVREVPEPIPIPGATAAWTVARKVVLECEEKEHLWAGWCIPDAAEDTLLVDVVCFHLYSKWVLRHLRVVSIEDGSVTWIPSKNAP